MATNTAGVIAGVDTHADTHHVAVIDQQGRALGDREFEATGKGYAAALSFIRSFGQAVAAGVEGTGTYGAGIARHLAAAGVEVTEVAGGSTPLRRLNGKSDSIDAYAAADAVLSGKASAVPKTRDGVAESLRVIRTARTSAIKARTAATNQIGAILIAGSEQLRGKYRGLQGQKRLRALAAARPGGNVNDPDCATMLTLRALARRALSLTDEIDSYSRQTEALTREHAPALRTMHGVGPEVAAQLMITAGDNPERITTEAKLAALAGTAPVPASSGKVTRHRLSRGGDRQANAAVHTIIQVRLQSDERTRAYAQKRRAEGRSDREIMRCLKRYVIREIFACLNHPQDVADNDLRARRKACGRTLTHAARELGVSLNAISRLERGLTRNRDVERHYRQWLQAEHDTRDDRGLETRTARAQAAAGRSGEDPSEPSPRTVTQDPDLVRSSITGAAA